MTSEIHYSLLHIHTTLYSMIITPQFQATKLSQKIGLKTPLYIKREDLHPLGSHKGRSIPLMIEKYIENGIKSFVISSSGNAGLASILTIQNYNQRHTEDKINLKIFVGNKIPRHKLKNLIDAIKTKEITIEQINNPKQIAFQTEKNSADKNGDVNIKFLRQSTDDYALEGYFELAEELSTIKDLNAVFIPTSSGTCAEGIYEGFKKLGIKPEIHIIQTDSCHTIAKNFYENNIIPPSSPSLALAIVDNVGHRTKNVIKAIKNTNGMGWIANNNEIREAVKIIKQTTNLEISPNSALSLVGLAKALKLNWEFKGPIVLLFTGN